jgi:hypothetical protein
MLRPGTPLSLEDARRLVEGYVGHYNKASAGDPRGTRPQVGNRQTATPESPPDSRVKTKRPGAAL